MISLLFQTFSVGEKMKAVDTTDSAFLKYQKKGLLQVIESKM